MKKAAFVVFVIIVTGCAGATRVSDGYTFSPNSKNGLVVLSTRYHDECGGSLVGSHISYEGITEQGDIKGMFLMSNALIPLDFEAPPGFFHIRELSAGQYRFVSFARSSTTGSGHSVVDIDMFFNVKPGEIYYLGEIYATVLGCSRYRLKVSNQFKRDSILFDQKMSALKSSAIKQQILKSE